MSKYSGLFGRLREHVSSGDLGLAIALDYVHVRALENKQTRTTDLVQKLDFGTGPTVLRKVSDLLARGYLESKNSPTDARAKILEVTAAGKKWLAELEKKIGSCGLMIAA